MIVFARRDSGAKGCTEAAGRSDFVSDAGFAARSARAIYDVTEVARSGIVTLNNHSGKPLARTGRKPLICSPSRQLILAPDPKRDNALRMPTPATPAPGRPRPAAQAYPKRARPPEGAIASSRFRP